MKSLIHISKTFWISTFLLFTICPMMGQIKMLKELAPTDYNLWSTLQDTQISDNGNWISFRLHYESLEDTLFVKNANSPKTFRFPKGTNGTFFNDTSFGFLIPENRFQLLNLETNELFHFDNVSQFLPLSNHVLIEEKASGSTFTIRICNYNGKIIHTLANISYYKIAPTGTKLAYVKATNKTTLIVLDLKTNKESIISNSTTECYPIIKWHQDGTSLLFAGFLNNEKKYTHLYFYSFPQKKLWQYDANDKGVLSEDMSLNVKYDNSFAISDNEENIYFTISRLETTSNNLNKDKVQIWNTKDKDIYPYRERLGNSIKNHRIVLWKPQENTFRIIGDDLHPQCLVNVNQENVLLYNQDDNKPSFKQNADITYWLFNTTTGVKSLFLKEQIAGAKTVSFSPDGKCFLYFKNQDWWLYTFATKVHTNLTKKLPFSIINHLDQIPETPYSFGFAGWSKNDDSVYIYDQYDIWELSTKDGKARQLTFGRKEQEVHRFAPTRPGFNGSFTSKEQIIIPGENTTVRISKSNHNSSGFAFINAKNKIQKIANDSKLVLAKGKAKNKNSFLFTKEDFNLPPQLWVNDLKIWQSNPQHSRYAWAESKLISYQNSKGVPLQGVLFFPANYDSLKRYPMLVSIYEKQNFRLHEYSNPSYLNGCSINSSTYTGEGYFVLLPGIDFEIGNPGFSALDCVTSAVKKVLATYPVDDKRIGLFGHSFGGYETDFIITQTSMFAAAVAGAGVANFNSSYLSYSQGTYIPQGWRYEDFQMRMDTDLLNDYQNYQNNSPVTHAKKITTPLLTFSGNSDIQVDPQQSKQLYLALRRLQKEHILLLYPGENHVIVKPENQKDLTLKIKDWFNYYLKDSPKSKWMDPL